MMTRASRQAHHLSGLQQELLQQIRQQTAVLERWREMGYEHWRQVFAYRGRGDTPPVWLHEALEDARAMVSRASRRLSFLRLRAWEMSGTAFPEEEIATTTNTSLAAAMASINAQDYLHWGEQQVFAS